MVMQTKGIKKIWKKGYLPYPISPKSAAIRRKVLRDGWKKLRLRDIESEPQATGEYEHRISSYFLKTKTSYF